MLMVMTLRDAAVRFGGRVELHSLRGALAPVSLEPREQPRREVCARLAGHRLQHHARLPRLPELRAELLDGVLVRAERRAVVGVDEAARALREELRGVVAGA